MSDDTCIWRRHEWTDWYETDCDETFAMIAGTATGEGMKYCCFCGKPMRETTEAKHDVEATE